MNFRRWVVFTFLIHVLIVVVDKGGGLILYLLTANQPDQHGKSGIAASLPFILGALANLGFATALVYFVRRGRYSAQVCFETSMAVALVWGSLVAVVSALFTLYLLPCIDPKWTFDPIIVLPICAAVPLILVASYANSTQLATEHIKDYGFVHLFTALSFLPAFFGCFFLLGGSVARQHVPLAVAWGRLASAFCVALLAVWLVRKIVTLRLRVHRDFLVDGVRYGWKANLTSTLSYLNHRLDLVVLGAVLFAHFQAQGADKTDAERLAATQVAFYSMSVTWAELVWHFPEAMRDLFFSKVAGSSTQEARYMTPVLSRLGLALSLIGALLIVWLVDPLMGGITSIAKGSDAVWHTDWSPTVGASLLMLVPGTVAYTVSKVLQADLAARNHLQTCVNAQLLALVVMLGLDLLWIPEQGAVGAAAASTVAYVSSTIFTLWAYGRQTGTPIWRCLFVHTSDFRYIREIAAAVVGKLRRKRA
ncbi:MAG TPA: polysaccharide biosynthesis C-terminal domain-containing protein [Planctomycetota bacterium]|nr:polysaccharide biosynthesis C-terminal domain-containing protein [Planctomycetota bacterium]